MDDASQDETADIARQLGLDTIVHMQNKGYGGNQKTLAMSRRSARVQISL